MIQKQLRIGLAAFAGIAFLGLAGCGEDNEAEIKNMASKASVKGQTERPKSQGEYMKQQQSKFGSDPGDVYKKSGYPTGS